MLKSSKRAGGIAERVKRSFHSRGRAGTVLPTSARRPSMPTGLVIMQEVNDPLSLIKQKEVRKGLRATDDGKQ